MKFYSYENEIYNFIYPNIIDFIDESMKIMDKNIILMFKFMMADGVGDSE